MRICESIGVISNTTFLHSHFEWMDRHHRSLLPLVWLSYVRILETVKMVSFDMAFHDDTKCFVGWRILIFGSSLFLSTALTQRRTSFFRQWALRLYTLVYCLKNRPCIWRQENQVDVREVLDFKVSRVIATWKGNLSALSSKRWVKFSYLFLSSNFFSALCIGREVTLHL